jgi:hypothetical protein
MSQADPSHPTAPHLLPAANPGQAPRRTGQWRDIFLPTAIAEAPRALSPAELPPYRGYKRTSDVPRSASHLRNHLPLPLELPSAAAIAGTTSLRPPPPSRPCTPSQPKTGRGIKPPCRPLCFAPSSDPRRARGRRQSPPAGLPGRLHHPSLF